MVDEKDWCGDGSSGPRHKFRDDAPPVTVEDGTLKIRGIPVVPPSVFEPDHEGPCPSCGAELGRDHRPGCRLPGVWSDLTHCQRVVQERRERCIVLWNAARHLIAYIGEFNAHDQIEKRESVLRISRTCLEGGPLGHQGHITDDDRLSLDDLERVSGAKGRPRSFDADVVPDAGISPLEALTDCSAHRCGVLGAISRHRR